ncbi:LysR substrate-binding domain-containing protein, partial [Acinetobacter baumannii]
MNEKGRALLARADEIIRLYEGLGEAISDVEDLVGTLSIGAISTASMGMLPDALARLSTAHPRLKIRVINALSSELVT